MSWKKVQTPTGERWVVRWRDGGRGTPAHKKTFLNERDAKVFDASITRAKHLGQLASEVLGSDQTVKEFVDEWWEKHAEPYLKPGTLASYAYVLDRWIVPYLGRMRLRDVTREAIGTYVHTIRSRGAGAPTVNRSLAILQGILQRAVEWRRIAANPVAGIPRVPHLRDSAIDARPPETVEAIRRVVEREHASLISVLAYEGLRPAEAYVLEWRDVLNPAGLPRERLQVRRSLSGDEVSTPKSARAREPELFAPVARELAELYLALGRPAQRSLVFPAANGGHVRRHNWRQRVWIPALAAAFPCETCAGSGEEERDRRCAACAGKGTRDYFRPYDLRHTCATLLIYEGRSLNEIAEHLGHADPGFTARTYGHVFRDGSKRRRIPVEQAIADARGGRLAADGLLSGSR